MQIFAKLFAGHAVDHFEHVDDALKAAHGGHYDLLMLDHDLDGLEMVDPIEYNCGTTFVTLLEAPHLVKTAQIIVHSHNSVAAENMMAILKRKGYTVVKLPFGSIASGQTKINL